jgi:hypothetical protein
VPVSTPSLKASLSIRVIAALSTISANTCTSAHALEPALDLLGPARQGSQHAFSELNMRCSEV